MSGGGGTAESVEDPKASAEELKSFGDALGDALEHYEDRGEK